MRTDVPLDGDTQHSREPVGARGAKGGPKADEVHQVVGAIVGAEERRARTRVGATEAPEYLRRDYLGSAKTLDRRPMKGDLQVSEWRSRVGQPDGRLHRRLVHTLGRPQGRIRCRRLQEC